MKYNNNDGDIVEISFVFVDTLNFITDFDSIYVFRIKICLSIEHKNERKQLIGKIANENRKRSFIGHFN